ncbi:zinc ribbon domain-containing protein [Clostridium minihomine]|uniref:zinc ribbon domain-containing protein n=1 Tax=Clostridium minihomine TaxID=2045012 RepID=UPI000C76BD3C|nr:zinc ribbon domain-containing protein [Clostridium minihomine]
MFLIMGVTPGEKKLNFEQKITCPCCGRYGSLEATMTYQSLHVFFLPLLKWEKRYFIKTTCCQSVSEINPDLGTQIAKGYVTELNPSYLQFFHGQPMGKRCAYCGYSTEQNFSYCPKCGRPF